MTRPLYVHARDERGDGVSDYLIEVLRKKETVGHRSKRCTRMFMHTGLIRAFAASIFACQEVFWLERFRFKCGFARQQHG